MQEDDFFNDLNFKSLRDNRVEPTSNRYQDLLDAADSHGMVEIPSHDGYEPFALYAKEFYINEDGDNAIPKSDYVLVGDECVEYINDPDDLEDALNSWGVY